MDDNPLERLAAPRATPDFAARLEAFVAERERARARRWRRVAIAAVAAALAATAAAGVLAFGGTAAAVDETFACGPIPVVGGVNEIWVGATTRGVAHYGGAAHPFPGGVSTSIGVQQREMVGVTGSQSAPTIDSLYCSRAPAIRPTRAGLTLDGVYRTGDIPNGPDKGCFTAARITIRLKAQFAHGKATAAELYIASGARKRPVALLEWTPTKQTAYLAPGCHDRV
jgi:hypothetical protein